VSGAYGRRSSFYGTRMACWLVVVIVAATMVGCGTRTGPSLKDADSIAYGRCRLPLDTPVRRQEHPDTGLITYWFPDRYVILIPQAESWAIADQCAPRRR
jgi:hypothetical protein